MSSFLLEGWARKLRDFLTGPSSDDMIRDSQIAAVRRIMEPDPIEVTNVNRPGSVEIIDF